jgi:ubiquinone/menaquinone biosynthesis C-methylase UbiE
MPANRVPLDLEPIDGAAAVVKYDRYAARFMQPEYRLTAHRVVKMGVLGGRVLDIGTGSGRLAFELIKNNRLFELIGLDVSADMLKQALNLSHDNPNRRSFNLVQATAARLPFPDESFDAVTSYASLHHWQQPVDVFNEIWRVTKNNGWIVIRDNRRMLSNPFYRVAIGFYSLFVKPPERGRWPKSIMASYTVAEVKHLLSLSQVRNYRVYRDMGGFDLCIEALKTNAVVTFK